VQDGNGLKNIEVTMRHDKITLNQYFEKGINFDMGRLKCFVIINNLF